MNTSYKQHNTYSCITVYSLHSAYVHISYEEKQT